MIALLLALLLFAILFGVGFSLHFLWIAAAVVLVVWLLGFFFRSGPPGAGGRWYRW
jgi:hypothetical protein